MWTKVLNVPRALADVEHILRLEPNNFQVRRGSVQILLFDGRYDQAEREAIRCLKARPKDVELWQLLARSLFHRGRAAEAAAVADRLLREAHVVGTPGSGFGPSGEGYLRLTAFGSREEAEEAVARFGRLQIGK